MTISPFGWVDNSPPDIDAANLEAMHAAAGAYTDAQIAALLAYVQTLTMAPAPITPPVIS